MKRLIFTVILVFILAACSSANETSGIEVQESNVEEQSEMSDKEILNYMDQIVGMYLMADNLPQGSEEQALQLDKALTNINITEMDIEEDYEANTPVKRGLLRLVDKTRQAVEVLQKGEYHSKNEYSKEVGIVIGNISGKYLGGKLPTTVKAATGKEDAEH